VGGDLDTIRGSGQESLLPEFAEQPDIFAIGR
jgi:hypothetical protein